MATPKAQRIGIWVIAIAMTVGTIGSFAALVLANQNSQREQEQMLAEYQKQLEQQQKAQTERQKSLRPLKGYEATAFDAATVDELQVKVLKAGTGEKLTADSGLSVNYFGWTADGKIFDSTNIKGETTPAEGLSLDGVIEGWTEGLTGKRVGSVVELTIPTDMAYGDSAAAQGRPAGPLKFIVEIIAAK